MEKLENLENTEIIHGKTFFIAFLGIVAFYPGVSVSWEMAFNVALTVLCLWPRGDGTDH